MKWLPDWKNSKAKWKAPKNFTPTKYRILQKKYDFLGEMTLREEPDIDTQDYIFCFEKVNGTSEAVLDKTLSELYDHMDAFSKANDIEKFSRNTIISYKR